VFDYPLPGYGKSFGASRRLTTSRRARVGTNACVADVNDVVYLPIFVNDVVYFVNGICYK
jgi:hypothetical protein